MILQIAAVLECRIADATFIRAIVVVCFLVDAKAGSMIERSITKCTLERFLSSVNT